MRTLYVTLIAMSICSKVLTAAEILEYLETQRLVSVAVEHPEQWKSGDAICLLKKKEIAACGSIVRSAKKGIILSINEVETPLFKKDRVTIELVEAVIYNKQLTAGFLYPYLPYPMAHVQELLSAHVSYGILLLAIRYNVGLGAIKGFATLATLNWYSRPFEGLWLRLGLGPHIINAQKGDTEAERVGAVHFLTLATVGWRFLIKPIWAIGLAAGGQYFLDPTSKNFVGFSGLVPYLGIEVGLSL